MYNAHHTNMQSLFEFHKRAIQTWQDAYGSGYIIGVHGPLLPKRSPTRLFVLIFLGQGQTAEMVATAIVYNC